MNYSQSPEWRPISLRIALRHFILEAPAVAGNNWYNAIELSRMILARMLNVWLLLLASFSFCVQKGIEMALKGWFKEGKGIGFRGD